MFTDMDLTIRALPGEDVQKVIRRVKKALGGNLSNVDQRNISYEVQKALTDPTLNYRTELESRLRKLQKDYDNANLALATKEAEHASEIEGVRRSLEALRCSKEAEMSLQKAANDNALAALWREVTEQVSAMQAEVRLQKRRSETLEVENSRRAEKERFLFSVLKALAASFPLIAFAIGAWLIPDGWVACFKSPLLARIGVSLASVFCLIAVVVGESRMRIVLIVISVLSLIAGLMRALV